MSVFIIHDARSDQLRRKTSTTYSLAMQPLCPFLSLFNSIPASRPSNFQGKAHPLPFQRLLCPSSSVLRALWLFCGSALGVGRWCFFLVHVVLRSWWTRLTPLWGFPGFVAVANPGAIPMILSWRVGWNVSDEFGG